MPSISTNWELIFPNVSTFRLHGQMQRIISTGGSGVDKVLGDLYEDIHWILLISGNILTLVKKLILNSGILPLAVPFPSVRSEGPIREPFPKGKAQYS